MSEILNSTGGANQTVKAVLDAIGLRYPVEIGQSEDGSVRYTRYSDGYIEIEGHLTLNFNSSGQAQIVFPIAFSNTNYSCSCAIRGSTTNSTVSVAKVLDGQETTSGVRIVGAWINGGNGGYMTGSVPVDYVAKGY